jgi:type IV pilus assembly protein PilO
VQDLLDRIAKLSGLQKLLGAVAIYLLLSVGMYFALISPTEDRITAATARQSKLLEDVEEKRDIANNRDDWEKRVDALNEALAKALKELPNEREIPELLRRVSSIGKKIGLEVLLFQPSAEVKKDFYAEVPVKLQIEGSYHEVATFFDRVGKLNRIVNIRGISLTNPIERSGRMILRIEGTAVTYRFLSDSEQEADQANDRRRRRR